MEWYKPEDKKPLCHLEGKWHGKKSDPVLVLIKDHNYQIATCFEGTINGEYFYRWHFISFLGNQESKILEWTEIKR